MKRNRLFCLLPALLALVLLAPGAAAQTPNAARSTTAIVVNDRAEVLYGYNIGGNNYYRLRDVAALLAGTSSRFSVDFNAATGRILLTAGADYQPPRGSRLPDFPSDETPRRVSTPIELGGVRLDLDAYNIGGNSYFKLRDLGQALSFYVAWDGRAIYIDTKPPEGSVRMLSPFPFSGYDNRLTARYPRWAAAPTSFLAARETGGFHGVVVRKDRLDLFALDPWYRLQGTSELPLELRLFGTFYSGRDHYYLVFGQSNQSHQDDREVIRISRYTKQFEKVDSRSRPSPLRSGPAAWPSGPASSRCTPPGCAIKTPRG